jgi:D-alanine-D-alanine ligase-like ATP-grasp enzyme
VDLGVAAANEIHFIKANANPILAADEDFAQSAPKVGVSYAQLFECIMRTGLKTVRE